MLLRASFATLQLPFNGLADELGAVFALLQNSVDAVKRSLRETCRSLLVVDLLPTHDPKINDILYVDKPEIDDIIYTVNNGNRSLHMNMSDAFARIDAWERAEIAAASKISCADAKSVVRAHAISKKFEAMRQNVMKAAFNAEQFNRRADWIRKGHSEAAAAAMFPVSK